MSLPFRPIRLIQYVTLIGLEVTLVHQLGRLVTGYTPAVMPRWDVLFVVAAVAAFVTSRFEPIGAAGGIRPVTIGLALVTVVWGTTAHASGLRGSVAHGALWEFVRRIGEDWLSGYVTLGATLWAWWRGMSVPDAEHADVLRVLKRGIIAVIVILAALTPTGISSDQGVVGEVIAFLLLGLAALSLARIVAAEGEGVRAAQWRWLRSSVASTAAIFLVGLLLLALLAEPARALLREGLLWTLYAALAVLGPVFWLAFSVVEALLRGILALGWQVLGRPQPPLPPVEPLDDPAALAPSTLSEAWLVVPTVILALIPLVALILLIVYTRRRRQQSRAEMNETHESIFSWGAVGSDLRAILGALSLRRSGAAGLQAALGHLRGSDPSTRIRRRYVELLLVGESAGRERRPAQTPQEFEPELASETRDKAAIDTLTMAYEQARYAPEIVDEDVARRAEAAWQALRTTDTGAQASSNHG